MRGQGDLSGRRKWLFREIGCGGGGLLVKFFTRCGLTLNLVRTQYALVQEPPVGTLPVSLPAKVAFLVVGALLGIGGGFVIAGWFDWSTPGLGVALAVAAGLCVPAAVVTLLLYGGVRKRWPMWSPVAVLLGTGLRMMVAVVGVFLIGDMVARHGTSKELFGRWVAYSYLVTLVLECGLLVAAERRAGGTP